MAFICFILVLNSARYPCLQICSSGEFGGFTAPRKKHCQNAAALKFNSILKEDYSFLSFLLFVHKLVIDDFCILNNELYHARVVASEAISGTVVPDRLPSEAPFVVDDLCLQIVS